MKKNKSVSQWGQPLKTSENNNFSKNMSDDFMGNRKKTTKGAMNMKN